MATESTEPTHDLTTATTEQLWLELRSRFKVSCLSYSMDGMGKDTYTDGVLYHGTPAEALGVLAWSQINIAARITRRLVEELLIHENEPDDE